MVYDAGDDFSIASNPNGVWSYHQGPSPGSLLTTASGGNTPGWFSSVPSPPFGDFPYVLANRTGQTQNGNWEDGMLLLHPAENGLESVVRFTVPRDDTYTVRGLWRSNSSGATTANVWVNQSNLFGVNLSSAVGDQTFNFTFGALRATSSTSPLGRRTIASAATRSCWTRKSWVPRRFPNPRRSCRRSAVRRASFGCVADPIGRSDRFRTGSRRPSFAAPLLVPRDGSTKLLIPSRVA